MAASEGITRREMIKGTAAATAVASMGGLAGCSGRLRTPGPDGGAGGPLHSRIQPNVTSTAPDMEEQPRPVQGRSTVVTIQNPGSLEPSAQVVAVQSMVDFMLSTLVGGASNPWSKLLPDADPASARIGLKVNCLNSIMPTSPVLVQAIIHSLVTKGRFIPTHIVVWDRFLSYIERASSSGIKYTAEVLQGARAEGTYQAPGPDGNPLPLDNGPGYGGSWGGIEGREPAAPIRLSKILTEQTDFTINCPILKAHPQGGITATLKNCFGMIDTPGRFHGRYFAAALPRIYAIPAIRNSIKLTIMDSIRVSVSRNAVSAIDRAPGLIAASLDPLALDYYALDLCNQLRAAGVPGIPAGRTPPIDSRLLGWMEQAYQIGLGTRGYRLVSLDSKGDAIGTSDNDHVDGGASAPVAGKPLAPGARY